MSYDGGMHSFVTYVDEAGDEGFRFDKGSSKWFVLSAVVARKEHDIEAVKLVDRVRNRIKKKPRADLHFRKLKHRQRLVLVDEISRARLRAVVVMIHKPSLREPEKFSERFRLYFYSTRLLLERVSWLCRDRRLASGRGDGSAKIYFSNRTSLKYGELKEYLRLLEEQSIVRDIRINWDVIRPDQIIPQPAHQMMGLQIADAVASGFFVAAEPSGHGFTEGRFARMLRPVVYKHGGRYLGYGVKIWPTKAEELVRRDQLHEWYPSYAR